MPVYDRFLKGWLTVAQWLFLLLFFVIPAIAVILFIVSLVMMVINILKARKWKKWLVLMIVSAPIVLLTIFVLVFIALINMGAIRFM